MKKLILIILVLFPVVGLGSDYDMKCTVHKGDKLKPATRCENKEIVCYYFGAGFSVTCFKKEFNANNK